VAQFGSEAEAKKYIEIFKETFQPFSYSVSEIYLISRDGNAPFKRDNSIPLLKITENPVQTTEKWTNEQQKSESIENIQFPDTDLDPKSILPLVLDQVEKWLEKKNHAKSLPKTLDKLTQSIFPFCDRKVLVFPSDWILKQLEAEHFFSVEDNSKIVPLFNNYKPPTTFYYKDQKHHLQIETYLKCSQWIIHNKSLPRTVLGLQNSLAQVSQTTLHIDPHLIIQKLTDKNLIQIDPDFNVIYNH